ncbi:unnamed protein product [Rotaria sp. Silwood2]|nr:unnamed protein product [Rotaria sp. Silwood2]
MKQEEDEEDNNCIDVFGSLLISLAKSDEEKEADTDLFLQTSQKLFEHVKKISNKNKDLTSGGYYLSELLYLLLQAFSNNSIVRNIFGDESKIKTDSILFFGDLLSKIYGVLFDQEANDIEKLAGKYLLKIILSLTNYPKYLEVLESHFILKVLIKSLAKTPEYEDATKIWCKFEELSNKNSSRNESKSEQHPMIYISYNSANKEFYDLFVKYLSKNPSIKILDDHEDAADVHDKWDSLARVIKFSTIVIVLISSAYDNSEENTKELLYVINRARSYGKKLFIVETEANLKFNQEGMHILLKDKARIPYNDHTEVTAQKVIDFISDEMKSSVTSTLSVTRKSRICTII